MVRWWGMRGRLAWVLLLGAVTTTTGCAFSTTGGIIGGLIGLSAAAMLLLGTSTQAGCGDKKDKEDVHTGPCLSVEAPSFDAAPLAPPDANPKDTHMGPCLSVLPTPDARPPDARPKKKTRPKTKTKPVPKPKLTPCLSPPQPEMPACLSIDPNWQGHLPNVERDIVAKQASKTKPDVLEKLRDRLPDDVVRRLEKPDGDA